MLFRDGKAKYMGPLLHRGGTTPEICNENLTDEEDKKSREMFTKFVERTVKGVMDLENKRRGDLSSSLQVFCRVDVGVLKTPNGCFHYYVNELERSLTVGLYRAMGPTHLTMLNSTVAMIHDYIERNRRS